MLEVGDAVCPQHFGIGEDIGFSQDFGVDKWRSGSMVLALIAIQYGDERVADDTHRRPVMQLTAGG